MTMNKHDALIERLAKDASPVRTLATGDARFALSVIAAATVATIGLLFGFRADLMHGDAAPILLVELGLLGLLAAAAGMTVTRMARPQVGAPPSGAPWALAALMMLPVITLAGIIADPRLAAGLAVGSGLRCLALGLVAAGGALGFLFLWLKRGAPVAAQRASLLAGLAAGSIGAIAVAVECPYDSHLGVWHVAVVLAAGGLARIVLPRFLRW